MNSNDHYRAAMKLVREVEEAIEEVGDRDLPLEVLTVANDNWTRGIALAQVHATLALVRKD